MKNTGLKGTHEGIVDQGSQKYSEKKKKLNHFFSFTN